MDRQRRARIILIVGVLLALLAGAGTFLTVSGAQTATPVAAAPTVDVVVAARELPARTALTVADVKVVKVNVDAAPPAGLKDPKEAIGRVLLQPVTINEPLVLAKFASADRAFTVFPPGEQVQAGSPAYRVMTITVPDQFAVGGILAAGDVVDIMYVFAFDPLKYIDLPPGAVVIPGAPVGGGTAPSITQGTKVTSDTVAKIILGPMPILARVASVYTIRVDAALAERIAYIQTAGGALQFLLRAPTDDRAAGTTGATFQSVYTQFKFPIPEKVPAPR